MDSLGGGRRSPPKPHGGGVGIQPAKDGRGSRTSGRDSGLPRGIDGRFCSVSKGSNLNLDCPMVDNENSVSTAVDGGLSRGGFSGDGRRSSTPLVDAGGGSLMAQGGVTSPKCNRCGPYFGRDEHMEIGCSHAVPLHADAAGDQDTNGVESTSGFSPILEENLGVNDAGKFMFSPASTNNLPSSSLKFCLGTEVSLGSLPEASRNHPLGVWENASSNPIQSASVSPNVGNMFIGDKGSGGAWQRPKCPRTR